MKNIVKVLLLLLLAFQLSVAQDAIYSVISEKDTVCQNVSIKPNFNYQQLILPTSLILTGFITNGGGATSLKNKIVAERNKHFPDFKTNLDNYLQYSPIVFAYSLDAFGSKSYTDIQNRTAILIKGELCMIAITQMLKHASRIQRPDQSDYSSFPSGHTAQAFAAATFLNEEYKRKYSWMPYVSYSIASLVGVMRMANNKHYISDVLVGAGIGILSIKLSYWTHQYKWNKYKKKVIEF